MQRRSRRVPSHDLYEPIRECAGRADGRVDRPGECRILSILRADDDAKMSGHRSAEPLEVLAMDGEHAAIDFALVTKFHLVMRMWSKLCFHAECQVAGWGKRSFGDNVASPSAIW